MTSEYHGAPARPATSRGSARNPERPLSDLPTHLSNELFAGAEMVRLPAGRVLFWEGDSGDGCYRVEDGLIKLTMISKSGAERILAFHGPGTIVGVRAIIDGLPRPMSAVAVRDAVLSFVSRTAFAAFAEKHPELCQSLLKLLTSRMRERDKMLAATTFLKVKGRIAKTLLELAEHFGQEVGPGRIVIRQRITQHDLAAMVGTAREAVARALSNWQRRKLLSRPSGYYCLENKALLELEVDKMDKSAARTRHTSQQLRQLGA
jgi:CRP/FNR family transcriptional regulator, cyclic AMP receptor protein